MEEKTFVEQIAYLSAAYDREISTETSAVYWHQLSSLPDAPFRMAVVQHVARSKHFPRVSELREVTQTVMRRMQEDERYRVTAVETPTLLIGRDS